MENEKSDDMSMDKDYEGICLKQKNNMFIPFTTEAIGFKKVDEYCIIGTTDDDKIVVTSKDKKDIEVSIDWDSFPIKMFNFMAESYPKYILKGWISFKDGTWMELTYDVDPNKSPEKGYWKHISKPILVDEDYVEKDPNKANFKHETMKEIEGKTVKEYLFIFTDYDDHSDDELKTYSYYGKYSINWKEIPNEQLIYTFTTNSDIWSGWVSFTDGSWIERSITTIPKYKWVTDSKNKESYQLVAKSFESWKYRERPKLDTEHRD